MQLIDLAWEPHSSQIRAPPRFQRLPWGAPPASARSQVGTGILVYYSSRVGVIQISKWKGCIESRAESRANILQVYIFPRRSDAPCSFLWGLIRSMESIRAGQALVFSPQKNARYRHGRAGVGGWEPGSSRCKLH